MPNPGQELSAMPKFSASSINDLFTIARDEGRLARKVEYIVACEASDGSWCEFDADNFIHAKVLAHNAVHNLHARGCSVWAVRTEDGHIEPGPALYRYFWEPEFLDDVA
jgi:hypothetical protein